MEQGGESARRSTVDALQGCLAALREIERGLKALRYPVTEIVFSSAPNLDDLIVRIQRRTGLSFPPVLVEFWRTVGGVALVDLEAYAHVDFWREQGVATEYCDGLMIDACTSDWAEFVVDDYGIFKDEENRRSPSYLIELAPDGYHKDDISGGPAYGVHSGNGWRADWQGFGWCGQPASAVPGPVDFMAYLRTSVLECAGFPGLFGDSAFEPIRRSLLRNVKGF